MTKEKFTELVISRYEELKSLNSVSSFYEYEQKFDELWREVGREVLQHNISAVTGDRRKKKL